MKVLVEFQTHVGAVRESGKLLKVRAQAADAAQYRAFGQTRHRERCRVAHSPQRGRWRSQRDARLIVRKRICVFCWARRRRTRTRRRAPGARFAIVGTRAREALAVLGHARAAVGRRRWIERQVAIGHAPRWRRHIRSFGHDVGRRAPKAIVIVGRGRAIARRSVRAAVGDAHVARAVRRPRNVAAASGRSARTAARRRVVGTHWARGLIGASARQGAPVALRRVCIACTFRKTRGAVGRIAAEASAVDALALCGTPIARRVTIALQNAPAARLACQRTRHRCLLVSHIYSNASML